jgi:hypothetical protein
VPTSVPGAAFSGTENAMAGAARTGSRLVKFPSMTFFTVLVLAKPP